MERVIGIGEFQISNNNEDVFKIYGLASCIGIVLYCPDIKLLGIAHFLLPTANINPDLSKISPAYFVDTGTDLLISKFRDEYRCKLEKINIGIYGGADARVKNDIFNIGKRNIIEVKKKIRQYNLRIKHNDTGGKIFRTIEASVESGKVKISCQT